MNRLPRLAATAVLGAGLLLSASAHALEYPIGTPHNVASMEVAAVYLQPIDMEPEGHMRKASETDIHLEADIHALANNPNGIPEGFWVPHILVKYELIKAEHERGHQGRHDADGGLRRTALRRQRQAQGPRQVQGQIPHLPAQRQGEPGRHPLRPPHRPRHRRAPLVQDCRGGVGIHLRRHRQEAELESAKNYMLGTFVLRNSDRAGIIAQLEFINFHGLPADYLNRYVGKVRAVTPGQVQEMTRKYIDDTRTAIIAVGDRKQIEDQVKPYGPAGSSPR